MPIDQAKLAVLEWARGLAAAGIQWQLHATDPGSGYLDCVSTTVLGLRRIGQATGDPAAWEPPVPRDYGALAIEPVEYDQLHRHFRPLPGPQFGAVVHLQSIEEHGHLGLVLENPPRRWYVLHCRIGLGVAVQRLAIVRPYVQEYLELAHPVPLEPAA